jgi:lipoprotein-anchoring transpeptidase ErfK/SrfK
MHPLTKLGKPVGRGGCPHSADPDARFLYRWAGIGTKVVVVR